MAGMPEKSGGLLEEGSHVFGIIFRPPTLQNTHLHVTPNADWTYAFVNFGDFIVFFFQTFAAMKISPKFYTNLLGMSQYLL